LLAEGFEEVLRGAVKPPAPPTPLMEMVAGVKRFRVLAAALELGVFDELKEPKTAEELAERLGTDRALTRKLCNALVAMGLLEKRGEAYANAPFSSLYLAEGSPLSLKHFFKLEARVDEARWSKLAKALKEGPLKSERALGEVFDETFALAMAALCLCGELQRTVELVSSLPELQSAEKLLDLGGGHGLYAVAFALRNPELEAYVLDLPHVIETVTKKVVEKCSVKDRIRLVPADFYKDDVGSGYDVVFASYFLGSKPFERFLAGLRKVASATKPGGLLVLKHWFLDGDGGGPEAAATFDLMSSVLRYGGQEERGMLTVNEVFEALELAGFSLRCFFDLSGSDPFSPARIIVAKKEGA